MVIVSAMACRANRPPAGMRSIVYGATVLMTADRNERRAWAEHWLVWNGAIALVPEPVVAQVSRFPQQALLRHFLTGPFR